MTDEKFEIYLDWAGARWRVTLPPPNKYTECSRAHWERMEQES